MALDPDVIRAAAAARVVALWTGAGLSAAAIAWPNVPFESGTFDLWLRPTMVWGAGQLATMNAPAELPNSALDEHAGLLVLNIFARAGTGDGAALRALAALNAGVSRRELPDAGDGRLAGSGLHVRFGVADGPVDGGVQEAVWWMWTLRVAVSCVAVV